MFDRTMKLPLKMEEITDENDSQFGSIHLVDQNDLYVSTVLSEDSEHRDEQNIIDTRKDAVFMLNAINNFDDMMLLIKNYKKHLLKLSPKSKEIDRIDNLINSFKTIDYDNGIPYNWSDNDI